MPAIDPAELSPTGLLPCPFCGSTDLDQITIGGNNDTPVAWIQCCSCAASGPVADESDQLSHRELWDERQGGEA